MDRAIDGTPLAPMTFSSSGLHINEPQPKMKIPGLRYTQVVLPSLIPK